MYNQIKRKERDIKKWFKYFFIFSLISFLIIILFIFGIFVYYSKDLPNPEKINKRFIPESTKIFDRTGKHLLYEIHGEEKRTVIKFKDIPTSVKYATISLEDQDFYFHHGIKISSIFRAALKDILHKGVAQGGSTITQQFIKNSILTNERTFTRKIKEIILAIEIEQKFSKDEILQMYLNEIPYGSNAYGIEAAAQTFFGKPAQKLTLDEAALLASLPKAPTFYSPYGSHIEKLKARQRRTLEIMKNLGFITDKQYQEAINIDTFRKIIPHKENIKAPHFVMYVKEYLENKYGDDVIEQGGLNVYTTLDWDKQQIAEKVIKEGVEKNTLKWKATNAALVAIDPKTGQILAMVGSKDYFDKSIDGQVNVAIRERQPGSSFKPYVYLTGFMKGYTPETILFDVKTDFEAGSDKNYIPQNYDGVFHGPIKIKNALGMSLNVPAVKMLYLVGIKNAIFTAKQLGITSLNNPERYGLSLVLGGGEVKLLDHVAAFATLANKGIRKNKTAILKIVNNKGKVLEEYKNYSGEKIVDKKYIAMLDHILSTNKYRAPAFGENNPLRFDDRQVVAKTGTTNEFRDGWTIGYTPSLAVGVWAGNNDNSPMKIGAAGANVAAPIWRAFLDKVLVNYDKEEFPKYNKEETIKDIKKPILKGELDLKKEIEVCEIPKKHNKYCLANKYCPQEKRKKKIFADVHNILWYVNKEDPLGDYPQNPEKDPQFNRWEKGVDDWYKQNKKENYIKAKKPEECKKDDFKKYLPEINLSVSQNGNILNIKAKAEAIYGINKIKLYIEGNEVKSTKHKEIKYNYIIPNNKNNSNINIRAKIIDENNNEVEEAKNIRVIF